MREASLKIVKTPQEKKGGKKYTKQTLQSVCLNCEKLASSGSTSKLTSGLSPFLRSYTKTSRFTMFLCYCVVRTRLKFMLGLLKDVKLWENVVVLLSLKEQSSVHICFQMTGHPISTFDAGNFVSDCSAARRAYYL